MLTEGYQGYASQVRVRKTKQPTTKSNNFLHESQEKHWQMKDFFLFFEFIEFLRSKASKNLQRVSDNCGNIANDDGAVADAKELLRERGAWV